MITYQLKRIDDRFYAVIGRNDSGKCRRNVGLVIGMDTPHPRLAISGSGVNVDGIREILRLIDAERAKTQKTDHPPIAVTLNNLDPLYNELKAALDAAVDGCRRDAQLRQVILDLRLQPRAGQGVILDAEILTYAGSPVARGRDLKPSAN